MFFNSFSIKAKLIFLLSLSASIVLSLSMLFILAYSIKKDTDWQLKETQKLANVSGQNIVASLTFLDQNAISTMLLPIFDDEDVVSIKVYDANANLFTSLEGKKTFDAQEIEKLSNELKSKYSVLNYNHLAVLSKIYFKNELIGFLQIIKTTDAIKHKIKNQFLFYTFTAVLALIIIFILSFWFEKLFSKPIYELLESMQQVERGNNYIYMRPYSEDEFAKLFNGFNHMVEEINKRDKLLKENNLSLFDLVNTKTDELRETKENLEELTVLATKDSLTGLANRRYAMEVFDRMIHNAQKEQKSMGVVMADIDFFKNVNDTYGHQVGDEVLKSVALIIGNNIRKLDLLARIGGEEFLILFDNGDSKIVRETLERIRSKIQEYKNFYEQDKSFTITMSFGFCALVPNDTNKDKLLQIADTALYKAKNSGRNRVVESSL